MSLSFNRIYCKIKADIQHRISAFFSIYQTFLNRNAFYLCTNITYCNLKSNAFVLFFDTSSFEERIKKFSSKRPFLKTARSEQSIISLVMRQNKKDKTRNIKTENQPKYLMLLLKEIFCKKIRLLFQKSLLRVRP